MGSNPIIGGQLRRHGWRLHITKRRQRAFKVVGLTWTVERTFAWLSQKSSLEQRLRVEGPNFGSLHRPGGQSVSCSNGSPRGKTSQTPSEGWQVVSHLGEDGGIIAARSSDRLYLGVDHRGKLELFCGDIHGKQ
jgi:hypothetical protein